MLYKRSVIREFGVWSRATILEVRSKNVARRKWCGHLVPVVEP